MSNSLRDQLLKAGFVDEKQARQAAREKQRETRRLHGQSKTPPMEEDKSRVQRAQAEKIERDRLLNQQRQEQAEKRAILAQVRQLVEQNRVPRDDGDMPYNFADRGKVKRLYVSDRLRRDITEGHLAIVRLDKSYELVPREVAEKIRARDAESLVLLNDPEPECHKAPAPDDRYAKFEIPDDLMW